MNINEVSSTSLSFVGDAYYTLMVRNYYVSKGYGTGKKLQEMCNKYNSAKGQMKTFNRLNNINFFNEEELNSFKRGRNAISHIPKNGDLLSYQVASGIEAIVGYLYLSNNQTRLDELFNEIFKGGIENE